MIFLSVVILLVILCLIGLHYLHRDGIVDTHNYEDDIG
jgi:hypothetical protein